MASTSIVILAKRPYQESALLLSGLSPDYGKLELVAHGAQKITPKSQPAADLYRELEVEFAESGGSTLHNLRRMEPIADFTAIAEQPKHFLFAGKAGNFILRNSMPDSPLPFTYDVLRSILFELSQPVAPERWTMLQCAVVLKCTFLYENGLLPESAAEQQNEFLENLVAAGIEDSPLPECRPEYWTVLHNWLNTLIDFHRLVR